MLKQLMILVTALALMLGAGAVTSAQAGAGADIHGDMTYFWNGFNNFDQNTDVDDGEGYAEMLTAIHFGGKVNSSGSYMMTLENYRVFGDETINRNEVYQATFTVDDFLFNDFDLTFGRMPVAYGRERVVGTNSWELDPEVRMTFEGYHGRYNFEGGWLDHFNFKMNETRGSKYDTDLSPAGIGDTDLMGFYMHYDATEDFWFEPYAILLTTENYQAPTDMNNDKMFTYGALVDYASDGIHFYAEATVQTGTEYHVVEEVKAISEIDTSALAWYAGLFYDFDSSAEPFIGFEYNFASGEDGATDEKDAYNSLAGSSRDYLGIMNIVAWDNVNEEGAGLEGVTAMRFAGGATLATDFDVTVDYLVFAKDQVADGADDAIGTEIDIQFDYALNDDVSLEAGVGLFMFDKATAVEDIEGDVLKSEVGGLRYEEPGDSMMFAWFGATLAF